MEEHYKDTLILITAGPVYSKPRWKPTCKIKFMKGSREVSEDLNLDLDYETAELAERAGLIFSRKWVDAGKPKPLQQ